jgi:hypothetical protein
MFEFLVDNFYKKHSIFLSAFEMRKGVKPLEKNPKEKRQS